MLQIHSGQLIGPCEVQGFLGRGAFAQVHAALDRSGKPVALKVGDDSGGGRFLPRFGEVTLTRDPRAVSPDETPAEALFLDPASGARAEILDAHEVDELLVREAEILASVQVAGVPRLHDVIEQAGRPVLVMDVVEGATLRQRIRSMEGVKLGWLLEVCRTLEELYAAGWTCHGDLKPENILVGPDERVFLIDPVPESCREDRVVTTPWYNPFLRWDPKGDAQSIAIILYELMAGGLPFDMVPWPYAGLHRAGVSAEERELEMSLYLSYPRMRDLNALAPRQIESLFHRAMCDESFSLSELRVELEDFLMRH